MLIPNYGISNTGSPGDPVIFLFRINQQDGGEREDTCRAEPHDLPKVGHLSSEGWARIYSRLFHKTLVAKRAKEKPYDQDGGL